MDQLGCLQHPVKIIRGSLPVCSSKKLFLTLYCEATVELLFKRVISTNLLSSSVEIVLLHRYSTINLLHLHEKVFLKSTSEGVLCKRIGDAIFVEMLKSLIKSTVIFRTPHNCIVAFLYRW